jgi:hypothetical protein
MNKGVHDVQTILYTERENETRCKKTKALLDAMPYFVESNHVFIIAVAHQHRRPDYWIEGNET